MMSFSPISDNAIATHVQQGFQEKEKRHQVLTQKILFLTWKVVIAAKLY